MSGGPTVPHSIRLAALLLLLTALSAKAAAVPTPSAPAEEQAAFDRANRYLAEQSMTRACDAFREFLKQRPSSALAREAQVKGARACLQAGKEGSDSPQHAAQGGRERAGGSASGPGPPHPGRARRDLDGQGQQGPRTSWRWISSRPWRGTPAGAGPRRPRRTSSARRSRRWSSSPTRPPAVEKLCERVLALEPSATDARACPLPEGPLLAANGRQGAAPAHGEGAARARPGADRVRRRRALHPGRAEAVRQPVHRGARAVCARSSRASTAPRAT